MTFDGLGIWLKEQITSRFVKVLQCDKSQQWWASTKFQVIFQSNATFYHFKKSFALWYPDKVFISKYYKPKFCRKFSLPGNFSLILVVGWLPSLHWTISFSSSRFSIPNFCIIARAAYPFILIYFDSDKKKNNQLRKRVLLRNLKKEFQLQKKKRIEVKHAFGNIFLVSLPRKLFLSNGNSCYPFSIMLLFQFICQGWSLWI